MPTTAIAKQTRQEAIRRRKSCGGAKGNLLNVLVAVVFVLTGCTTANSGRKAAHYNLFYFDHTEAISFLETLGYPPGSYHLQSYDRDEGGNTLRFWLTNRSNGTALVLVVPSSGDIRSVIVPSPQSYLNSNGELAAWVDDIVLRLADGKTMTLGPNVFSFGLDRSARFCYVVRKDPGPGGKVSRKSEITVLATPEKVPLCLDGWITGVYAHGGNVYALCIDFFRGPENELSYVRGVFCYTCKETPDGLELEHQQYISAPSRFAVDFEPVDMDAKNGRVFLLREFEARGKFLSPRFIYNMQTEKLVRIGYGAKWGLFLMEDIMAKARVRIPT
ncbi:MAG: hypothetical protein IT364_18615 [Candidatus Hydrogenedentes bacterium]|nr:hypothetical protein [Candidatus Hydrogenedentota bacterium]